MTVNSRSGVIAREGMRSAPSEEIGRGTWFRIAAAYLVLGAGAWTLQSAVDRGAWWLHGLWCIAGLAIAVPILLRALRHGFTPILVDHRLMFLAAFAVYFLFGAALLAIGPDAQAEATLRYYPIGAHEALRVDAVNAVGLGLALLSAAYFRGRWLGALAARTAAAAAWLRVPVAIGLFLSIGIVASAYLLTFDLGFREGVVPGLLRSAAKFSLVAIFLAVAHRGPAEVGLRIFGCTFAAGLVAGGTLQFNKTEALLPVASVVAGLSMRFGVARVLPVGLALLVVGYVVLGNLAAYGRSTLGYQGVAGFEERLKILEDGWRDTRDLTDEEEYGTWARLCYVVPQMAALDLRDDGQGGDGFRLIPWVFVPRLVAPDKPEITATSREFNLKITGSDRSSTGQGVFASGYYHGGWWGFVFASILCGWILAQTSAIARAILARRALVLLPLVLLGLFIAFRIDGDFVADYLGTFIFILYPLLAASALLAVGRAHRST